MVTGAAGTVSTACTTALAEVEEVDRWPYVWLDVVAVFDGMVVVATTLVTATGTALEVAGAAGEWPQPDTDTAAAVTETSTVTPAVTPRNPRGGRKGSSARRFADTSALRCSRIRRRGGRRS